MSIAEDDSSKLTTKIVDLERQVREAEEEAENWRKNAAASAEQNNDSNNNNNDPPLQHEVALLKEALRSRDDEITFLKDQLQHQQQEKEAIVAKKLEEYEEVAAKLTDIDGERRRAVEEKSQLEDKLEEMRQQVGRLEAEDDPSSRQQTEEKLTLSEDEIHRLHKVGRLGRAHECIVEHPLLGHTHL